MICSLGVMAYLGSMENESIFVCIVRGLGEDVRGIFKDVTNGFCKPCKKFVEFSYFGMEKGAA